MNTFLVLICKSILNVEINSYHWLIFDLEMRKCNHSSVQQEFAVEPKVGTLCMRQGGSPQGGVENVFMKGKFV